MICTGVPAEHIDVVWPWVEPLLEPALEVAERIEGVREDVREKLIRGEKQLYVGEDEEGHRMVLVTSIEDRPDGKVVYLAYLAGSNLRNFMQLQPRFVDWAKSLGCVALESSSPKAMLRWIKDWKVVGSDGTNLYRLRKELD